MRRFAVLLASALLLPVPALALGTDGALRIVIDPGHGGEKDGAIGPDGIKEKDVTLAIARALQKDLEAHGHEAILTRSEDRTMGLAQRIRLANDRSADLFVSIHANSMPTKKSRAKAYGAETYFLSAEATDQAAALTAQFENSDDEEAMHPKGQDPLGAILADLARSEAHTDSSRLAYAIHGRLISGTGAADRGVRQAPFFVLEGAAMAAVLVEVGYISHPHEEKRIAGPADQEKIARSIAAGIEDFRRVLVEKKARDR